MTVKHSATALLCLSFLSTGCFLVDGGAGPPTETLTHGTDLIVGTWEWQSSTYYFTVDGEPNVVTPESAGYTETLKFFADGTFERYHDGELEVRETYEITRRTYPNDTESEEPMLFMGESGGAQFDVDREELLISTTFVDGPESIYRRVD